MVLKETSKIKVITGIRAVVFGCRVAYNSGAQRADVAKRHLLEKEPLPVDILADRE
jgi:hypothetical protein